MPIVTTIEGRIAQVAIDRPEKRNTLSSKKRSPKTTSHSGSQQIGRAHV